MDWVVSILTLFKLFVLFSFSAVIYYTSPRSERLLPLRVYLIVALIIIVMPLVVLWSWNFAVLLLFSLLLCLLISSRSVSLIQRRLQLYALLNLLLLVFVGALVSMGKIILSIIMLTATLMILLIERRVVSSVSASRVYRMVFQLDSIRALSDIEFIFNCFRCRMMDQKMIKNDKVYLDVEYETSQLIQYLLMRRFLRLDHIIQITQY